jgi:hypothetical protein
MNAQPFDFANVFVMVMDADHANNSLVIGLGDPEMVPFGGHVSGLNVIDVQAGIIFRKLSPEETKAVQLDAMRLVAWLKAADLNGYFA